MTVSQAGALYVAANASTSAQGGDVEGTFRIGVDGVSWPYDRAVSVYTDPLKVRNKVATINGLQPVGAGSAYRALSRRAALAAQARCA